MIRTAEFSSPIGELKLASRGDRLCVLTPTERWERAVRRIAWQWPGERWQLGDDPGGVVDALCRYFDGEVDVFDGIDVELSGPAFHVRVWLAMRAIPAGSTCSYGALAARLGSPRGVRAVGGAAANNPIGLIVPCHRVIRSDGGLGGYGWGHERKSWLLEHEKARDRPAAPVASQQ